MDSEELLPTTAIHWFHGRISKEDAEFLLRESGAGPGCFLVRIRRNPTLKVTPDCVITLMDDEMEISHHLLALTRTGTYIINGTIRDPSFQSVEDVVFALSQPRDDWPIPLKTPVPINPLEAKEMLISAGSHEGSFIYHGILGEIDKLIMNVVYCGEVTHHLIELLPDGEVAVNRQFIKDNAGQVPRSVHHLIRTLKDQNSKWPIVLTLQIFPPKWNTFRPTKTVQLPVLFRHTQSTEHKMSRQNSTKTITEEDHGLIMHDTDVPRTESVSIIRRVQGQDAKDDEENEEKPKLKKVVSFSETQEVVEPEEDQDFSRGESTESLSSGTSGGGRTMHRKKNIEIIRSVESNFHEPKDKGPKKIRPPKAKFFDL